MNNCLRPGKLSLQTTPPFGHLLSALLLLRKQVEQRNGNGSVDQNGWCRAHSIGMVHAQGSLFSTGARPSRGAECPPAAAVRYGLSPGGRLGA